MNKMTLTNMKATNMKVETMTNPRNSKSAPSPHRKSRRNSRADKIWSAGLAATTCIGIVGVIGVRSVEANADAAASQPAATDIALVSSNVPTTSTGLTQADLEAYAAALDAESAKLDSYRAALVDAANALQAASGQPVVQQPSVQQPSVQQPKVTRAPAAQSAPQIAPAPQSNTKSS
ncbi:unannotated protein [freshwater metagenome]|uniref:Unannotated protein n=1 Tax=freshwater metagenome TaxID=449393 RepID=A0A6J7QGR9_9ZZZZ